MYDELGYKNSVDIRCPVESYPVLSLGRENAMINK
jgi:hypothetical protein